MLIISNKAVISPLADIEDSRRGSKIIIEEGAVIDSFVKIKPAGGSGDIYIGPFTVINSCTVIYIGNGVNIGAHVSIAANCTLAPTNHEVHDKNILIQKQGFMPSRGGIIIEDDVWIGANSVLVDGAILRRGCVIGAGSLVRGEVAAYSISAGNPLRLIRYRE